MAMYNDCGFYDDKHAYIESLRQRIMREHRDSIHCPLPEPVKKETKPNLNLLLLEA